MERKKFDFVVLNIQDSSGSGFGFDTNKVKLIDSDLRITDCDLKLKKDVAVDIVNHMAGMMTATLSKTSMNYA